MSEYIQPWHCIGRTASVLDAIPFAGSVPTAELWRVRHGRLPGDHPKAPSHGQLGLHPDR
jgi:hypothetical protein